MVINEKFRLSRTEIPLKWRKPRRDWKLDKNGSLFDNLNSSLKPRKIAFKEIVNESGTSYFWTLVTYLYNKRQKKKKKLKFSLFLKKLKI